MMYIVNNYHITYYDSLLLVRVNNIQSIIIMCNWSREDKESYKKPISINHIYSKKNADYTKINLNLT